MASLMADVSALYQDRPRTLRPLALVHHTETIRHLGIGLQQPAEIAAKTVLVELLVRLYVPEPARIGRYLIGHHDPHHLVFPQPAGLHLEVDQANADAQEDAG